MTAGVLVVVAAGPGLGRAVALRFAREGYAVGLLARTAAKLTELVGEVRAAGAETVATAEADVADEEALRSALRRLADELGPVTVLVFNGSAYVEGSALALATADLGRAVAVGVTAAMVSAQEVAPAMRAAGRGTIVLTGSIAADRASKSAAAVGVAKAGLRNLAMSLHKELVDDGVRVVSVTIDGVLQGPKALDVETVADLYWTLTTQPEAPPAVVRHPSSQAG